MKLQLIIKLAWSDIRQRKKMDIFTKIKRRGEKVCSIAIRALIQP